MTPRPAVIAALLAAAVLALGACGGEDEEASGYVDELNDVTATLNRGLTEVTSLQGSATSPQKAAAVYTAYASKLDAAAADVGGLDPPEDVADLNSRLIGELKTFSAEATNAANEIKAGGPAAITGVQTAFIREANQLAGDVDATIAEIDITLHE